MIDAHALQQLSPAEFWAFFCIAGGVCITCLYFFVIKFRQARIIEDTPTAKVRSAAQGFTELEGRALYPNGNPLISPLSQSPCAWFRFKVSKRQRSGKNTYWRAINSGQSPLPLMLADTTGTCLIHTGSASVDTHIKKSWYGHTPMPHGKVDSLIGLLMSGDYRYEEELILEHTPLYALGSFRTIRGDDHFQIDKTMAEVISKWKQDYAQLVSRFDRNADGKLDEKEWQLVRLAAHLEAEQIQQNLQNQAQLHIMEKPSDGAPFIVSTREQQHLVRRIKLFSFLWLTGFIATGAFCTHLLQLRLI
jgi:hypothetical protein